MLLLLLLLISCNCNCYCNCVNNWLCNGAGGCILLFYIVIFYNFNYLSGIFIDYVGNVNDIILSINIIYILLIGPPII